MNGAMPCTACSDPARCDRAGLCQAFKAIPPRAIVPAEWLKPGAVVPVNAQVVQILLAGLRAALGETADGVAACAPTPVENIWYMRDNHTFRALPLNVKAACEAIREEFTAGNSYGMLGTKRPGSAAPIHAKDALGEFLPRAREWLVAELHARGVRVDAVTGLRKLSDEIAAIASGVDASVKAEPEA